MSSYRNADVRRLYHAREQIDDDEVAHVFLRHDVLNADEGIKLCVWLALNRMSRDQVWDKFGDCVVNKANAVSHLESIGKFLALLHDYAPETDDSDVQQPSQPSAHEKLTKNWLAGCFGQIMDFVILSKNQKIAQKFGSVLRECCFGPKPALSDMLYTVSMRIWNRLKSPNVLVAQGAYFVQHCVYPPRTADKIEQAVYEKRHQTAFLDALKHDSVLVRVQALDLVPEQVAFWWSSFARGFRQNFLRAMVALAYDEVAEIRAALYKGLRHFSREPSLRLVAADEVLTRICKDGIDDVKEKVRLSCLRLMILFCENGDCTYKRFVETSHLINRLDFEENKEAEERIVRLLYANIKDEYGVVMQSFVRKMCRSSRNAALDFHRQLYCSRVLSLEEALKYVDGLLVYVKACVFRNEPEDSKASVDQSLDSGRNVLDCALVLYSTIQHEAIASDKGRVRTDLGTLMRHFTDIVTVVFERHEQHAGLVESALTLASLAPNSVRFMPKFYLQVERELRAGRVSDKHVQAFAMNDMAKFVQLLLEGVAQIHVHAQKMSSKPGQAPSKPTRPSVFLSETAVVDALTALLSNPTTSAYVLNEYDYFITDVVGRLAEARDCYLQALRNGRARADVPMDMFRRASEAVCVLRILLAANPGTEPTKTDRLAPTPRRGRRAQKRALEPAEELDPNAERVDPLLDELQFLETQFELSPDLVAHSDVAEVEFNCLGLYLRSVPHNVAAVENALNLIERIRDYQAAHPIRNDKSTTAAFGECRKLGRHALEFATPLEQQQPHQISTVQEEDEPADTEQHCDAENKAPTTDHSTVKSEVDSSIFDDEEGEENDPPSGFADK